MTLYKLLDQVTAVDGVNFEFQQIDGKLLLLLKRNENPIADVFLDEYDYNKEYIKLYEMNLYDIFEIDQALYEYTQTPVKKRGLQLL